MLIVNMSIGYIVDVIGNMGRWDSNCVDRFDK